MSININVTYMNKTIILSIIISLIIKNKQKIIMNN